MTRTALIRRPSPKMAEGIVTHIDRADHVDFDLATSQWKGYVDALNANSWETIEVDPLPECPDSVFIEDPVVVFGQTAAVCRSGALERRPEPVAPAQKLRDLGYRVVEITEPGTIDGGDVLKIGSTVYVGQGGRTNEEGIRQLGEIFAPEGARVVGVPLTKALHLKSAVTALPDGTVIGYKPIVDDPTVWENFLAVPEEPGSHVVILDEKTLLMSSAAPKTAEMLRERGYEIVAVPITEFEKMEGCVTCLSVRLRDLPTR